MNYLLQLIVMLLVHGLKMLRNGDIAWQCKELLIFPFRVDNQIRTHLTLNAPLRYHTLLIDRLHLELTFSKHVHEFGGFEQIRFILYGLEAMLKH